MSGRDVAIRSLHCIGSSFNRCRAYSVAAQHGRQDGADRRSHPTIDGRNRLSAFWAPSLPRSRHDGARSDQEMFSQAGIMRQAYSGIFHLLPLGLRVQDKIESLIDKHMLALGAGKVSLSSITSEKLWQRSGRARDEEFFRLRDRKGAGYLLSPTHEEEITSLIAADVQTYRDLPVRLYQISRKYRDEARPRHGLLRAREFLMKDLYTFDSSEAEALETYEAVRNAYRNFFGEIGIPIIEAAASSGTMGGDLSHEYHYLSSLGEDKIISCGRCGYAANEEVYQPAAYFGTAADDKVETRATYFISKDRKALYKIVTPGDSTAVNVHLLKSLIPALDASIEQPLKLWTSLSLPAQPSAEQHHDQQVAADNALPPPSGENVFTLTDVRCSPPSGDEQQLDNQGLILTRPQSHDVCPRCSMPDLEVGQAIELGHTFHLGTRYSEPFNAKVNDNSGMRTVAIQMGCHGIGISRLIAAVAGSLADDKGLNWPVSIAPFSAVIATSPSRELEGQAEKVYDMLTAELHTRGLPLDLVIDDRQKPLGTQLDFADVIGFPFIIVLGRHFLSEDKVELQCRRLGLQEDLDLKMLPEVIEKCTLQLRAI